MLLFPLLLPVVVLSSDIPLAPYNVKVFCRQGLRFTTLSQTAQQCPSSATACGYLEFSSANKTGIDSTGIFDCVESGMLKDDEESDDEYSDEPPGNVLFAQLCGSQASCSSLNMDQLNPAFSRYLVMQHGIKLEELQDSTLRFCCSLFHATLQKLIVSGADRLPTASATSMHCRGESCSAGAVGCLSHTKFDDEEYESGEEDRRKRAIRRRRQSEEDDDYGINAVEISFEDEETSLVLVSREPSPTPPLLNKTRQFLPSLSLPLVPPKPPPTKVKNGVKYAIIDEDEDDEEESDEEEMHCVYRHLNDELYRWCLFVHQSKTGDRCYYHQGHTVCCCFAPPDTDTCDPTEMELVIPGKNLVKPPPIKVTPRPLVERTTSSTTTTTTTMATTTTSTSTTTAPTTTTTTTTTTTQPPSTTPPRCRVTYTKAKGRRTPVLVCGSAASSISVLLVPLLLLLTV